ncbi:complex I subunit 4 family protein [Geminisphaera colitermitum]|uniref:complex I subunit 4 family protein n=1 Tax=Geminisphaera colitermitum TaxID=1148786 RepID=UPI0005B7CDC9|nr:NADH-quinone oxidoreductase subunit M [Geminisphaera colitermitum]
MTNVPLLSLIIFVPWIGALLLAALPQLSRSPAGHRTTRLIAFVFSLSTLALTLAAVLPAFDTAAAGTLQLAERHTWIAPLNINYTLGIDGISLVLVLLTGLIAPMSLAATWRSPATSATSLPPPPPRLPGILFLTIQGAALGVFLAQDFFLWFLFWELSLFPAFFLTKLYGNDTDSNGDTRPGNASRAAYQFVIYTMGGSAFMLLSFAAIYAVTGTLNFEELQFHLFSSDKLADKLAAVSPALPMLVFFGVLLGLAVKVPLFPFHTWLPSAYAAAPTGASIFLTAIMSKMGLYGFIRILWSIFPIELIITAPILIWFALAGVVFGAFAALRQRDLKRMIAYSSINHLGYCLLAFFAFVIAADHLPSTSQTFTAALTGMILQMFNHGLSAAALFYCIGILENRTGGLRGMGDFGGVRKVAPIFAAFCGISMFSSLGLPGLNGFVGEFLIFRGVFGAAPVVAAIATLGLLATALFLLTFWQRVFHGPVTPNAQRVTDLTATEILTLAPAIVLMFVLGLAPQLLINLFRSLLG